MGKKLFLLISFVLIISITISFAAKANAQIANMSQPFGLSTDGVTHTVTSGDLKFSTTGNGVVSVYQNNKHMGKFGFSLTGVINSDRKFLNSWDVSWTWQILSNTDSNITVLATASQQGINWIQQWTFQPAQDPKLLHIITNNTGFDSTGTQLLYIFDLNIDNAPQIVYTDDLGQDQNFLFDQNLLIIDESVKNYGRKIKFLNTIFNFQDLIDSGFDLNYFFIGNLNAAHNSLPNTEGIIVGVTKNNGFFPDGATIVLDPTITTALTESANLDIFDPASPNIFRVNSTNLGFIAHPHATVFFTRYFESNDNGLNWSEADFNFTSGGGSNDSPGVVFNADNNKVVLVYGFGGRLYAQEGDFDNNLLARTGWDNNVALDFTGSVEASRRSMDINSGNFLHVCGGASGQRDIECRYVDTDLNTADISNWSPLESSFSLSGNLQQMDYYIDSSDNGIFLYATTEGNKFVSMKVRYDVNGFWSNDLNLTADLNNQVQWKITGNQIIETQDNNLVVLLTTDDAGVDISPEVVLKFCDDGAEACVSNINNWTTYRAVYDENFLYWANVATDLNNNIYIIGTDCLTGFCNTNQGAQGLTYRIFYDLNKTVSAKFDVNAFDSNSVIDSTKFTITNSSDSNGLIDLVYLIDNSVLGTAQLEFFAILGEGDIVAPVTTADFNNDWTRFDQNITLTCVDTGTGCSTTRFRVDTDISSATSFTQYYDYNSEGVLISSIADANFGFDFNSTDTGGNIEDANTIYLLFDVTAPATGDFYPAANEESTTESSPNFALETTDTNSTPKSCRFHIFQNNSVVGTYNRFVDVNSDNWCEVIEPVVMSEDDTLFIHFDITTDDADNNSSVDINTGTWTFNAVGNGAPSPGGGGGPPPAAVVSPFQSIITSKLAIIIFSTTIIDAEAGERKDNALTITVTSLSAQPIPIEITFDENITSFFIQTQTVQVLEPDKVHQFVYSVLIPDENFTSLDGNIFINLNEGQELLIQRITLRKSVPVFGFFSFVLYEAPPDNPIPIIGQKFTVGWLLIIIGTIIGLLSAFSVKLFGKTIQQRFQKFGGFT